MSVLDELSRETSIPLSSIRRFSRLAPHHYKIYTIPKRSVGHRVIAHPSRKLKTLQRALNLVLANILPVHASAFAYVKKRSIKDNASQHLRSSYLLKMDFNNYFMSITPRLFWAIVDANKVPIPDDERRVVERLLFWCPSKRLRGKLVLSVGAPTSPLVANFVAYNFDEIVSKYCSGNDVVYTRYSDDLTFTTNVKGKLFCLPDFLSDAIRDAMLGYVSLNERKTVFSSKAHNRHVTGITLTSDGKLSIGRDRKRYISSLVHKYCIGILADDEISHAQGLLSFASDVEPSFLERLRFKYSSEKLSRLMKHGV